MHEVGAYAICFTAGFASCGVLFWLSRTGEKSAPRGKVTGTPWAFGYQAPHGDVMFLLEQYIRLIDVAGGEAVEVPSPASASVAWLALKGEPDLALWLMHGIAILHDNPQEIGDEIMRSHKRGFLCTPGAGLAGALLTDLSERVHARRGLPCL